MNTLFLTYIMQGQALERFPGSTNSKGPAVHWTVAWELWGPSSQNQGPVQFIEPGPCCTLDSDTLNSKPLSSSQNQGPAVH